MDGVALFVYSGISIIGAVAFWLVTTYTGSYPAVARYGGAAWIFILLMIVLMPVVIPRVRRRARAWVEKPSQPDREREA
jgi:hypothetical protein